MPRYLLLLLPVLALGLHAAPRYRSKMAIYDLASRSTRVVYEADEIFEAPNWTLDGKQLIFNQGGKLFRLPLGVDKPAPQAIVIDPGLRLNNDHGPSPDGRQIAFSARSGASNQSQVYVCDADGSNVRLTAAAAPSYFHGWSPDGRYLTFVHAKPGTSEYHVYRIPAAGGEPEQLNSHAGYDDGPEYSPDGKWIYYNSDRSGGWDIWRIPSDGAGPNDSKAQRVTGDELEDWFAHFSPDGKWMVFLSFAKGVKTHNDKLPGTQLRLMTAPGGTLPAAPHIEVLTTFYGGQGTINVNSWSPDSKHFAYVIYEPILAPE